MTRRLPLSPLLIFFLLAVAPAHACSCMGPAPCGAAKLRGTLFLGEVLTVQPLRIPVSTSENNKAYYTNIIVRIHVREVFHGDVRAGQDVDIRTGGGGGDCGYTFKAGLSYLVDAYDSPRPGTPPFTNAPAELTNIRLSTGICSMTAEESNAAITMAELRTALAHGRQPDLHGTIKSIDSLYEQPGKPLAGLTVSLASDRDGTVYRQQTDASGIYTFPTLPPGGYTPSVALPQHRRLVSWNDSKPPHVEIPANDGTGMACHYNASLGATGGISGHVTDAEGKGRPGSITAHRTGIAETYPTSVWTNNGDFTINYLPDGEYTLEFNNYAPRWHGTASATVHDGDVTSGIAITATMQPNPQTK